MATSTRPASSRRGRGTTSSWKRMFVLLVLPTAVMADQYYYNNNNNNAAANQNNANYNYYNNNVYNQNYNATQNDDDDDDGNDDQQKQQNKYYSNSNATDDDNNNNYYGQNDDWAANQQDVADDDLFHWDNNVGFDGVSIMPVSCVNYNNGHMIKFEFFQSEESYQCHFAEIGTFVVSIAHYMRAYFNYQAVVRGQDFALPDDVGYLNCIQIQATTLSNQLLYAKIGCKDRETFTSTKLALHLYTDATCSTPYEDGFSSRRHSTKGFETRNGLISSEVSFRPAFYTCQACSPDTISETFNKRSSTWYDDEYISENGGGRDYQADQQQEDDGDDYYVDDGYLSANDDVYRNRRLDEYATADGADETLSAETPEHAIVAVSPVAEEDFQAFENEFWMEINTQKRQLYENNYDIDDWNMCQRVYKYGMWCDEECRSLDAFRTDEWSTADMALLGIMCVFMASMMLLVVAKRIKAAHKRRSHYGQEDLPLPGLPPIAMLVMYLGIMAIIVASALLKFINPTLVFAVVICILLFIYMLKLTLFDNKRRPVLLATARHDVWDSNNKLDDHLFT